MTAPSSRPDTPAQEHADVVRRSLYDDVGRASREALSALDALLTTVERLTAERDELREERLQRFVWRPEDGPLLRNDNEAHGYETRAQLLARAEAAERDREAFGALSRLCEQVSDAELDDLRAALADGGQQKGPDA